MSEEIKIKSVQTSRGELRYYRDWDNYEGGVVMVNPQTIDRYREIREGHPKIENYACFFAFGQQQFDQHLAAAIASGRIKEGEKLYHHYSGLYGTHEGITSFLAWYEERDKAIPVECALRRCTSTSTTTTSACCRGMATKTRSTSSPPTSAMTLPPKSCVYNVITEKDILSEFKERSPFSEPFP